MFCGFIDLKRAFDSVWRSGLLYKIQQFNITGKCYKVIKSMYNNIKSCVSVNGVMSSFFESNIGVRQGENLSPFLFAVFLNDLELFLSNNGNLQGVDCTSNAAGNMIYMYLKIFVLLYADDTVILSESSDDLQIALNMYAAYCKEWKLEINNDKTKVMVFTKERNINYTFTINGVQLEVVSEYKYLGILFSRSGSFSAAKVYIANKATRAMFSLLKKARDLLLPIDLQIELFQKTIKPILLYGCEVWGFGDLSVIERVQLKFLKYILNMKRSTPNCIVYGETGVIPLKVDIKSRMVGYWAKLVSPASSNLSTKLYFIGKSYFDVNMHNKSFIWFSEIRNILIACGNVGFWNNLNFPSKKWLVKATKHKLTDLFISDWKKECESNTSCNIYRIFKTSFGFDNYLKIVPSKFRKFLIKIRTRNHKLPVETGRWRRASRELRKCHLCDSDIGDEYHYIMSCKMLKDMRRKYLDSYYLSHPNTFKFSKLMNCKSIQKLKKLCLFIQQIFYTL